MNIHHKNSNDFEGFRTFWNNLSPTQRAVLHGIFGTCMFAYKFGANGPCSGGNDRSIRERFDRVLSTLDASVEGDPEMLPREIFLLLGDYLEKNPGATPSDVVLEVKKNFWASN